MDPAWSTITKSQLERLEILNRRILRMIFRTGRYISNSDLYKIATCAPLQSYLDVIMCCLVHAIYLGIFPPQLQQLNWFVSNSPTRSKVRLPRDTTSLFVSSPFFSSYTKWLALPLHVRQAKSLPSFRNLAKQHFNIPIQ